MSARGLDADWITDFECRVGRVGLSRAMEQSSVGGRDVAERPRGKLRGDARGASGGLLGVDGGSSQLVELLDFGRGDGADR